MKENTEITKVFARKLYSLRTEAGFTQAELASRIGITPSMVSLLETASYEPNYTVLVKLADTLGVSTDYLLGQTLDRTNKRIKSQTLPPYDTELLLRIASLPEADREKILSMCDFLYTQQSQDKNDKAIKKTHNVVM